jgi:hypothetical protein
VTTPARPSALAVTLQAAIHASRRIRVPVEDLRQAALAADLSFTGSPDARARLLAAIRELETAGEVTLPRGTNGWEAAPRPALPRWVARPAKTKPDNTAEPAVAWHADLSWVPAFLATDRPTAAERLLLRAVNGFLGAGGSDVIVPLRERSLQLAGDEKALDTVSRGRLFAPGRLSLGLLSTVRVSPPLVRRKMGEGPLLLLVENYATYDSLSATLPADGEVGTVAYSAGNTLGAVLSGLADEGQRPHALAYFGDLDTKGLEIAAAGTRLATDLGLPPLNPAEYLYRLLIEHGRPASAGTYSGPGKARAAATWLPVALRAPVLDVLLAGKRLAQEAVGREVLSRADIRAVSRSTPDDRSSAWLGRPGQDCLPPRLSVGLAAPDEARTRSWQPELAQDGDDLPDDHRASVSV